MNGVASHAGPVGNPLTGTGLENSKKQKGY